MTPLQWVVFVAIIAAFGAACAIAGGLMMKLAFNAMGFDLRLVPL